MAVYEFEALDQRGRSKKGVREADTPRQLRQQLRSEGLAPVSVAPGSVRTERVKTRVPLFRRRASTADIALITRQLATLVAAAIPLEECLQALSRQVQKAHLKAMITNIRSRVLEGQTLADSLSAYPEAFDSLFRAMVAAGEKSGHLDTVLERLADYNEQRQQIQGKLIQAMVYPVILTLVAIGVVAALLTTVVPTVVEQFAHLGQDLPASTLALIAISDFVRDYGIHILAGLLVALVIRQRLLRIAALRLKHDKFLLRMPVIGPVLIGVDTSRFARTLSILTSSNIPLLDGMKISAEVMVNTHIREALLQASEKVREGSSLWHALDQTRLFPPTMLHIIASGEKSGELESMLARAADAQDRLFDNQVSIALGIFGPLLILSMAGMVLFIVVSILTPMLDLNALVAG
ncbi:type II secretion system inner membrane protein GspF [Parendozoicomonas haliclonae]|uniref:General secretion pathway protein F n=1 Tax=Parendozoicomonas haliclonae TaxID=1960125 RepID=A0A1X7AGM0_9GAMM|nr:type II secretion system inner membrane protein GspF [Parendozoicomonas haliclonae]SMA40005.1 Type II secretion system protein F [Parendozoicomonas haliclonae]